MHAINGLVYANLNGLMMTEGERVRWHLLALVLVLAPLKASTPEAAELSCPQAKRHSWLQHCASAEDCTSEVAFCTCCGEHGHGSAWSEACSVICGAEVFLDGKDDVAKPAGGPSWRIDD